MEDVLITEHAGTMRDAISRFYQYGSGGVRVLDSHKTIKRLYLFEPSSDIMTERDPRRQEKILRRFVFDTFGMLEETFAFGERPRTFRYENGARQIAVREGGDYGAVGKIFTFEPNGITETAWGRNGEIERVYQVDARGDAITVRSGGWYGDVERTIVFAGMGASLFREPEAFLQFLMFTEWSAKDRDEDINERVAQIRGAGAGSSGGSPFAYTGTRHTSPGLGDTGGQRQVSRPATRTSQGSAADGDIDFIPDGDEPVRKSPRGPVSRKSSEISFEERRTRDRDGGGGLLRGRSAEIPLQERFESPDREPEQFSRGKSAEIPLDERFENAQKERGKLTRGRSAEIPYDERRGGENR
ncbi:MAG: hypothetical protein LUQ69_04685 [Methanoregulaceae archaeon]|nr:hypothetical protein [Methanoregulaceae archaeon]